MNKITFILLFISSLLFANSLEKTSLQLMWEDQFEFAGFYIAKEKGFYKDVGLDVELKKFDQNLYITDEIVNRNSDFGVSSNSLIIDKSNGKDIILLGAIFQTSPLAIISLKNSNINKIEDFANKKLMITGEQLDFATFRAMVKSNNVDISSLKIIPHSFDVNDLINKKIDLMLAYITNEPFLLQEKGYEAKIFYPKDYGFDFYEEILFTSKELFDKNPALVKNFYDASIKGWNYAFSNIDEAVDIVVEKYNSQNKSKEALKFEALAMKELVFDNHNNIGTISKDKINLIANTYKVMGFMKNEVDVDSFIFNQMGPTIDLSKDEKNYLKSKRSLTYCSHHDSMPFEAIRDGKHIGMLEDYIKQISQILNIDIKFIPTKSWDESYEKTLKNECDFLTSIATRKGREDVLKFTNSYADYPLVIATKVNEPFIEDISGLKNKKVAILGNFDIYNKLKNKYSDIEFIIYDSIHNSFDAVKKGEVYAAIDSIAVIGYEIQNHFLGEIKVSGKLEDKLNLYMATAYENSLLIPILNKALLGISDIKRQEFFNKWLYIDYHEANDYKYIIGVAIVLFIIFFIVATIYRALLFRKANIELARRVDYEVEQNDKRNQILFQQSKLAAMGEMLENIAHQWRQPLSTISVSASGIKLKNEMNILTSNDIETSMNHINQSVSYLTQTIEDFRSFVYEDKNIEPFKIKNTIQKAIHILAPTFSKYDVYLLENYEDIEIISYENNLLQCLMNIITNAIDALKNLNDNEKRVIYINTFKDGENVKILICDSGKGIKKEVLPRIFEPYFTTKHKSQGTGVGLYMCKNILEQNLKGTIFVDNREFTYENKKYFGAYFEISIPKKIESN